MDPLFERLRKCAVFIGTREPGSGKFIPTGTGFLIVKEQNDFGFQYIVTARHVIEDIRPKDEDRNVVISYRVNRKDGGSDVKDCKKIEWHRNSSQRPYNDIAVLRVQLNQDTYDVSHVHIDSDAAVAFAPYRSELGQEIITVGLFTSHYGQDHNIPIVRFGTIAATPDEPIWSEYGYMDGYLVDLRSIDGLSGSPVFWRPVQMETAPIYIIGVVHGHFLVENPADAISPSGKERTTGQLNTGIGLVMPIQRVKDIVDRPDLEQERKAAEATLRSQSNLKPASAGAPSGVLPASEENPTHREDFTALLGAAVKKPVRED